MSTEEQQRSFPRRDAEGRILTLGDLLGVTLAGLVIGVLALVLFEWAFATMGAGEFGRTNGWLAVILPLWLFWDDFRAWEFGAARVLAALAGLALGVFAGLLAAGLAAGLPALVSGALAAAVFTVVYAVVWFHGVHWLARRTG
ncbi:hypothetical protein ACFFMM_07775 [Micromonospora chaiyaphumensis]|uniref:DUF3054 domain-containing protein n=1 Tax=Micromonospora chaiyaphumensis TaxID=307119 RepID=A0A1C4VSY8_9ACTN|nr:hypothetical protein [Micromonospora chaiyaphumensis]SCE87096.1 hypothetical protein GA0070214_102706 [Micromonospora chaiyaphumensis]